MKNLKISLILILALAFNTHRLLACHGSPLQNYNVTVGATGVTINAASDPATCGCGPYWMQTQISCSPAFVGTIPNCLIQKLAFWNTPGVTQYVSFPYFNSILNLPNYTAPNWVDNCALENYNANFIPFSGLCPGKVYYIRSREVVTNPPFGGVGTPFPSYGAWTGVTSFTVPGTAPTPQPGNLTLNLNAAPQNVICGGGTVLTPSWLGSCPGACAPTFPSCEATTTVVPSYSFVASNPVIPAAGAPVTTTVVPAASPSSVITIPNLPTTTSFSVYFVYQVITAAGTTYSNVNGPNAFPFNLGNSTNSFVTAPAGSTYMNAFTNCLIAPCTFIQPGQITVNVIVNIPTINATVTANTCLSSPSFTFQDLNNTAGLNYSWNFGDGSTAGVGNPITHNYSAAGIYTVTLTKSGGPSCVPAVQTLTVEVYPTPGSTLSVNSPVCFGGTASFTNTQTNGATYAWSGPNNFVSNQQNPVITNVTANHAGVYTCTTTSQHGCTFVSTVNLATYQATINASANGPICAGSPLNLTAIGNGNYSWTGPNSYTSNVQNPSFTANTNASGNYIVMATLQGNCYASATVAVVVNTTAVTVSNTSPICFGNNLNFHAIGNGSFSWSGPNGFSSNNQYINLTNPALNVAGVYTVTITSAEGCTASATTTVVIQAPKILNPKATPSVCEGGTLYFEALDGSGEIYSWVGPNNYSSANANTAIQDAIPANTGQYTLTIKDVYGCTASAKVNVLVTPKPNLDIDMSKAIAGCAPVCKVEYLAKSGSAITEYVWNLGNGESHHSSNPTNICYNHAGNYSITLTGKDVNGCEAKVMKVLEVYPTPKADFSYVNGPTWTSSETKFKDESTGANIADWKWTFGMGPDVYSTSQNPNFTYQDSGSYHVTLKVTSDKGCESMTSKTVKINDEMGLYVPNAFTPNGDGSNDVFMAVSNNVTKFEMLIFNRWGALVYQSTDIKKGWDGTYKGGLAESAVYVYKISYTNRDAKVNTLNGNVTLIR